MIAVDASVVTPALQEISGGEAARLLLTRGDLTAPQVIHLEVASSLRALERRGSLTGATLDHAATRLNHLPIRTQPITPLLTRIWELRHNITPYGAAYIALAERFGCDVATFDKRLARSPGARCGFVIPT